MMKNLSELFHEYDRLNIVKTSYYHYENDGYDRGRDRDRDCDHVHVRDHDYARDI